MYSIKLTHQTATGHRIPDHENGRGKCARLHGHTYAFEVSLSAAALDESGFVADFGAIKKMLDEWDHRLVLWQDDAIGFGQLVPNGEGEKALGVVRVPFVPTAENMARHFACRFALEFEPVHFAQVVVHETEKSSAEFYCSADDALREREL